MKKRFAIEYAKDGIVVCRNFRDDRPMIRECQEGAELVKADTFCIFDEKDTKYKLSTFNSKKRAWNSKQLEVTSEDLERLMDASANHVSLGDKEPEPEESQLDFLNLD